MAARQASFTVTTHNGQASDTPTSLHGAVFRPTVSLSHSRSLTLATADAAETACDVEAVLDRPPETWRALLGNGRYALAERIALQAGEPLAQAATRVWCGMECLKKTGAPPDTPLVLSEVAPGGWVMLQAGLRRLATLAVAVQGEAAPLVFGVLALPGS